MKKYAHIINNRVAEVIETEGDIAKMFHPDMVWIEVTGLAGIANGWQKIGADFVPPAPSKDHTWGGAEWVITPEKIASQVAVEKNLVWNRVKAERDRRIQFGGYKVGTKWYHSDTFSRTQQMGLVMLGANIPANTPWKTMDGSFVVMTQTLANQIFGTAAASDIAIFSAAEAHRVAMEASPDPAAYNFAGGWPVAYGE